MPGYPVFLNISSKKCVVVGGGQVALRKVASLLECGASIMVISPDLCSKLSQLAESGKISVLSRRYRSGDLKDAFLAVAATDGSDTNMAVVNEARSRGVLVNVVDDAGISDFIVPSSLRRGDVTISVSTGGKSPALARKIRTMLERRFGEEYASLALLVEEVRAELKRQDVKVDPDTWQEALDIEAIVELLRKGETEQARSLLRENLLKTRVR